MLVNALRNTLFYSIYDFLIILIKINCSLFFLGQVQKNKNALVHVEINMN